MDVADSTRVEAAADTPRRPQMCLCAHVEGKGQQTDLDPERIAALRANPANYVWLDIVDPGPAEIDLLRRQFGFHELALEDVARRHQRPKCDTYEDGGYYFLVLYVGRHTEEEFVPEEIEIFWGQNYLVTVHDRPLDLYAEVQRRWRRQPQHPSGVAYLVYSLLDAVVDGYLPIVDWIEERAEGIEERIFPRAESAVAGMIFETRKQLVRMRRVLAPTRDVLNEVIRRDLPLYPEELRPYFVDVYDHTLRALDQLDLYRDLLESALDVYLSATSNYLNQLVKRMTALTLLIMAPTLVAGVYGMNFKPLPPYDTEWGFLYSIALMLALTFGGILLFRWLDWF